jgi:hypothetical protein
VKNYTPTSFLAPLTGIEEEEEVPMSTTQQQNITSLLAPLSRVSQS